MRMGGRLKRLKRDFKGKKLSDGKTIGRWNRLTDNLIDTFQHYYGKVLKGNKVGMIRAVNANWHYYSSIEEEPMHQFCPPKPLVATHGVSGRMTRSAVKRPSSQRRWIKLSCRRSSQYQTVVLQTTTATEKSWLMKP